MRTNFILIFFVSFLYFVIFTTLVIGIMGLLGIPPFRMIQTILGILFIIPSSIALIFLTVYVYIQFLSNTN